ncbi:MFS transporter [Vibrio profundum]|uniref:MFS transporter n=1 Tax=Vibrio profundum TaxID=2910247 RepID=UPI003D0C8FC2
MHRKLDFYFFFVAQGLSVVSFRFFQIVMAWALLQGRDSGYVLGMMITLSWGVNLISFPFAGYFLDKFHKAIILIFSTFVSTLSILAFYFNFTEWGNSLTIGVISISLLAFSNAIFSSAPNSIIPLISNQSDVSNRIGYLSTLNSLQPILGAILGGAAISIVGVNHSFILILGMFVVSMLSIIPMFLNASLTPQDEHNVDLKNDNVFRGFSVICKLPPERTLCLKSMVINSTLTPLVAIIIPVYIKLVMEKSVVYFSVAEGLFGGGMLIGSFLAIYWRKKSVHRLTMTVSSIIITGICVALFALLPDISYKYVAIFVIGVCLSIDNVACNSLRALATPNYIRGRLESTVFFFAVLSIPAGSYVFSKFTLPDTLSLLNPAIVFMGGVIVLSSLLVLLSKNTRRALKTNDSDLDGFYEKNYLKEAK